MKTLIVYATKYGSTEKCAKYLQKQLPGEAVLYCVQKKDPIPELESFDAVVLGGAIYVGRLQKPMRQFITQNTDALLKQKLGLFFVGATPDEKAADIWKNFPGPLLRHASVKETFGGEVQTDRLTFFDRKIMSFVQKNGEFHMPEILYSNIEKFAAQIQA